MKNHKNTDKKSDVNKINVPELKVAVGCTVDLKSPHSKTLHRTSMSNFQSCPFIHQSIRHLWMLLLKEAEDTLQITYNNYQYQLCSVLSHFKYARVWAPLEDAQSEFSCLRQLLPTV